MLTILYDYFLKQFNILEYILKRQFGSKLLHATVYIYIYVCDYVYIHIYICIYVDFVNLFCPNDFKVSFTIRLSYSSDYYDPFYLFVEAAIVIYTL